MNGFRIKSAKTRGGIVKDISVEGLRMKNVQHPFSFLLNWNPSYSYCTIPKEYQNQYLAYWDILSKRVNEKDGMPIVRNITVNEVVAKIDKIEAENTVFEIEGFSSQAIEEITLNNVSIEASEYGFIKHVKDFTMNQVQISLKEKS